MKLFVIACIVAGVSAATLRATLKNIHARETYEERFDQWRQAHARNYTAAEYVQRLQVFADNVDKIEHHNAAGHTWTMRLNEYSDLSPEEFADRFGLGSRRFPKRTEEHNVEALDVNAAPASVDWRTKGAVTPVKNQGQCGSCWAFSTTGSTEGAHFLSTGKLVSLSEQQLVDCSAEYGNEGCNGGIMDNGFRYIIGNKGIDTEASYPYTAKTGKVCNAAKGTMVPNLIGSYSDVTTGSAAALKAAVAQQPVSVAIEADKTCFQHYSSGVLTAKACACGTQLDHGVLVVGYGTDTVGGDYWIARPPPSLNIRSTK